jgi:hypothetical protein
MPCENEQVSRDFRWIYQLVGSLEQFEESLTLGSQGLDFRLSRNEINHGAYPGSQMSVLFSAMEGVFHAQGHNCERGKAGKCRCFSVNARNPKKDL